MHSVLQKSPLLFQSIGIFQMVSGEENETTYCALKKRNLVLYVFLFGVGLGFFWCMFVFQFQIQFEL